MKLIIQIPCYNEEKTLPATLADLPKQIDGIETIETLIIDDGSTDNTVNVARDHGVNHIVSFKKNKGLAQAFMAGIQRAINEGADIIVNTDGDNQYCAADIPKLVEPILRGEAEIVIGARPIDEVKSFSSIKKLLQKIGSWVVRIASKTDIPDAPSGFRAFTRNAAMRLNVFNRYTYTLEMIIQAGRKDIAITSVPIRRNKDLRPSRLFKSVATYVRRSMLTILRIFITYEPFKFFFTLGAISFSLGFLLGIRWLILFALGTTRTHVPSLILTAILILVGFLLGLLGILADIISVNRQILEEIQLQMRKREKK